jgi:hypothetical protein
MSLKEIVEPQPFLFLFLHDHKVDKHDPATMSWLANRMGSNNHVPKPLKLKAKKPFLFVSCLSEYFVIVTEK